MIDRRPSRRWEIWTGLSVWISAALCIPLLLLEGLRLHHPDFHPHFAGERWYGFYAGLSTISCLALVAIARVGREVVADSDSEDELR